MGKGTFKNVGDKSIESITKVEVKLVLGNDSGDTADIGKQYFENIELHLAPGETGEATLEFTDVPYYEDATQFISEEGDWEFTYFE
ncbi:hypothetical protein [Paenibacillus sp. RC67]|uniref:hypothetical protein n=1 Tax=Paenibacillus sp. RC67 TaxID=3039392 RepID=UPI0024ADF7B2|nr:hypothetical protein [Paenibacillus sp. RC67]